MILTLKLLETWMMYSEWHSSFHKKLFYLCDQRPVLFVLLSVRFLQAGPGTFLNMLGINLSSEQE